MSYLPKVPYDLRSESKDYLIELVRQIERELRRRPQIQRDGALYLATDLPLRMVSPNGTIYEVSVNDAGNLITTAVAL